MKTSLPPRWALQDAKNRFSEVVNAALKDGPQIVTRRGTEAAVVLSFETYRKLERQKPKRSLGELLRSAPRVPGGLVPERTPEPGREVELE